MKTMDPIPLKQSEFKLFQELMYSHAGVRLGPAKHALVQNRLRKRLRELNMTSYRDYYEYIVDSAHPDEFQVCLNCLTTNETYFFRHKNHWDFFTQVFLPTVRRSGCGHIRIWSAAASTGAEAYSAAIACHDAVGNDRRWTVKVDATDINEDVLKSARAGCYDDYALQKLTPLCVRRYFEELPNNRGHRVRAEVRKIVDFAPHNLIEPKRGPMYDLVFLRNVLIYFDDGSKRTVVENISQKIRAGGYLILGGAETLSSHKDQYDYIQPTIYQKKRGTA